MSIEGPRESHRIAHAGSHRGYRNLTTPREGETTFQVVVGQTDLLIAAEQNLSAEVAAFVHDVRGRIAAYIALRPEFGDSLVPLCVPRSAPKIIRDMADAAAVCGVGPMAAVAGAVAQAVAEAFQGVSPNIIVENGGDAYLCSTKPRTAALLADPEGEACLAVRIEERDFPLSLCASSAYIGKSLSLGRGDLAAVASPNACLADCAATALCNMLQSKDDLEAVVEQAEAWRGAGVRFVFAQCDQATAVLGDLELTVVHR